MSFSVSTLIAIVVGYLFLLFFAAYAVEKGWLPTRLVRHSAVYTLSLGVYASAWAFYGTVGMAHQYGYAYITYYLGISGAFVLAPVLLKPILRITQQYQLTSLSDLFAFRFRSRSAGTLTTIVMLAAILPLLTLQITAVSDTYLLLNNELTKSEVALGYCVVMAVFAVLFGARHVSPREKHEGLVFAIAFESLLKLVAIAIVGLFAMYSVFDGPNAMDAWLQANKSEFSAMQTPINEGPWRTLLLVFFAAAVVMPHMFHMAFTENSQQDALNKASWGLPLFLLIMAVMVPPILWAGIRLDVSTPAEYFALGIGLELQSPLLTTVAFLGGLAAASGIMIVTTLALAAMAMNHLVLPIQQPTAKTDMYRWLLWTRRWLIAAIFAAGYAFYSFIGKDQDLARLGILAFVATLQFLPGVLATLYWPSANRNGFVAGLAVGTAVWLWTMLLPLLAGPDITVAGLSLPNTDESNWYLAAMGALVANAMTMIVVSLTTSTRPVEESAAEACSIDTLGSPQRQELVAKSTDEFVKSLSAALGPLVAEREVEQALSDLQLENDEVRPYALRRLRFKIEANLSGLMGPSIAHNIVSRYLPFKHNSGLQVSHDIHFIEKGLENYHNRLTGLAAELDNLRRFHRQTLERLPMGACSLGTDGEILMWNSALAAQTNIPADEVVGSKLSNLKEPWRGLLMNFIEDSVEHLHKKTIEVDGRPRWLNLHKGALENPDSHEYGGLVILLEDQTDTQLLEDELVHSERLASVGRLAAGVAHEIGNPVTGIACIAQDIKYETDKPELIEMGEQILEQTQRISRIVQSLMNFSHTGNHHQHKQQGPVDIRQCAQAAIDLLQLSGKERCIQFVNTCPDNAYVLGDEQRLQQVFVNLLSNARDASNENSRIWVNAQVVEHTVTLNVTDEGAGISQDVIDQIFEPFFTTKEVGKGTGLGLALVYSIIEEHYGHISIESPANEETQSGTRVVITLPRYLENFDEPGDERNNSALEIQNAEREHD